MYRISSFKYFKYILSTDNFENLAKTHFLETQLRYNFIPGRTDLPTDTNKLCVELCPKV